MAYHTIPDPKPGDDGAKAWANVDSKGEIVQVTSVLDIARRWYDSGARVRPLRWAGLAAQITPEARRG